LDARIEGERMKIRKYEEMKRWRKRKRKSG
jgi:hypothetical protein